MTPNLAGIDPVKRHRLPRLLTAAIAMSAVVAALTAGSSSSAAATGGTATGGTATTQQSPACSAHTLVRTADGPLCGITANEVTSYLGIDYAAPPVGNLRWVSPQPVKPWTTTLQATTAGNICPSPSSGAPVGNEDCLNLNVQVPAGTRSGARLPVMVEVHGGGFLSTASPDRWGVDPHLVLNGNVIFVAMNYRLGILGFMANTALGPHSGDYGLQDQEASLEWVKRNISRFGGDPHNVTVFGQSAGGASACLLAASPPARGLFEKGISESGFYNAAIGPNLVWEAGDCKAQLPTEAQAQRAGAAFAGKVGCGSTADVLACLRAVPVATLLQDATGQKSGSTAGGTIAPTINGTTLPLSPGRAFATGRGLNNVSMMIGVSRDEINGGDSSPPAAAITAAQYAALVRQKYGRLASTVERLYPIARFPSPSPFIAFRTIVADSDSVCPALVADRQLARHHIPVYAYEDDNADTPNFYLNPAFPNGAFHVAEGQFVSPLSGVTLDANQAALAEQVTSEWTGYARTGNPTVYGTPLWTRYTSSRPEVMSLVPAGDSALVPTSTLSAQHNCGFWDAVTPTPKH